MHQHSYIGVPEGEEGEKGAEKLLEEIAVAKPPQSVEGNRLSKGPGSPRVPNKMKPKGHTPRHTVKMVKVKDKERILKAASEKQFVVYKQSP